jgi:exonuclease SbcC
MTPFENFGIEAPPEVKQLIGMYTAAIDTDHVVNINVADQDTPLFLLPESAPTKTKYLNRLTGLHVVDAAIRDVRTERTYSMNVKKNSLEALGRLQDSLKKYDALEGIKDNMHETYLQMQKVNQAIERYNKLHTAVTRMKDIDVKLSKITRYVSTFSKAKPLSDTLIDKYAESKKLFRLGCINNRLSCVHLEISGILNNISGLKKDYNVCPICLREWK